MPYVDNVSESNRPQGLPQGLGGILADGMGMGKTLSMIALIASDHESHEPPLQGFVDYDHRSLTNTVTTLVLVPSTLLALWENELFKHIKTGRIKYCRYHGKDRLEKASEIDKCDIVIMSIQTVASEWKRSPDGFIFSKH
jgi:SNF2 family DNA or RNA helicase